MRSELMKSLLVGFANGCAMRDIQFYTDWTCCQSCGHAEAEAEAKRLIDEDDDYSYQNYVFYHWQDTALLNHGAREVYLSHNLDEESTANMLDLIKEWGDDYIYWTGDKSKRIYVTCDAELMKKARAQNQCPGE